MKKPLSKEKLAHRLEFLELIRFVMLLSLAWILACMLYPAGAEASDSPAVSEPPNAYQQTKKSIVFLYGPGKDLTKTDKPLPDGTGFIVGLTLEQDAGKLSPRSVRFVVTNKHVTQDFSEMTLRINHKDDNSAVIYPLKLFRNGAQKNVFLSKRPEVDLAVINIPDIADTNPTIFDMDMIVDTTGLTELRISEGTDIFTAGFLFCYPGARKNEPVFRSGKLAMITDEAWLAVPGQDKKQYGYLGELATTFGASGSPVLLQPSQFRVTPQGQQQARYVGPRIIGVIKGFPNLPARVETPFPTEKRVGYLTVPVTETLIGRADVSNGLAAIEPATYLKEIMLEIAEGIEKNGTDIHGYPVK